ncbi:MAG TPA: cyclase family protein [Polyangiaceae bacterium]|nr:cyclase family protein [Polyangiaceae bacterium]
MLGRRRLLAAGVASALTAACDNWARPPAASAPRPTHWVDLTHTLSPEFPFIPVQNKTFPFRLQPIATNAHDGVYANRWELTEHVGTHLDAPCHFLDGASSIEQIDLGKLVLPAAIVSIAERVARDEDAVFDVADLLRWERVHGEVPRGGALFLHTGWASRVTESGRFVNLDAHGVMHFPGFSPQVADLLIHQRAISGIGIDTLSVDPGRDTQYPVHKRLSGANKWALECLTNLEAVPATGATAIVAAVKVRGASGAPARVLAFW